jgi:hypothetical protein
MFSYVYLSLCARIERPPQTGALVIPNGLELSWNRLSLASSGVVRPGTRVCWLGGATRCRLRDLVMIVRVAPTPVAPTREARIARTRSEPVLVLICREVNRGREACRVVEYSSAGYASGFR